MGGGAIEFADGFLVILFFGLEIPFFIPVDLACKMYRA